MYRLIRTVAVLTIGLSVAIAASSADLFPRGVYWPHERARHFAEKAGMDPWEFADQQLGLLKEHNCNFIWTLNTNVEQLRRLCEIAASHDIVVVGCPESVYWWRQHRTPEFAVKTAEWAVDELGESENLYGYVLLDEPRPYEFPFLDAIREHLKRLDPTRKVMSVTMRMDSYAAVHRTGLDPVCTDLYPFFSENDPNGPNTPIRSRAFYRAATEALARQCQHVGKPFWFMGQGGFTDVWGDWYYGEDMHVVAQPGAYLHWRCATVGETRWQIWQGLAAGAKGVLFYVLFPTPNERTAESAPGPVIEHNFPRITESVHTGGVTGLLNIDLTPSEQMTAMGEAFADLERLEPLLQELSLSDFPAAFAAPPLHVLTHNDAQGNLYAIVVNDNTDAAVTGDIITLPGITGIYDLRGDAELPLVLTGTYSLQKTTLTLGAGDGTLLQLVTVPETRPMACFIEDFFVLPRGLENARVLVHPEHWTGEWQYDLVQSDQQNPPLPGTITCPIAQLTGDPNVHRPSGPIYVVYQGSAPPSGESVILSFSTDGDSFSWASVDEFNTPIPIPRGATHLRFTIKNGGSLAAFYTIATELPNK